MAIRLKDGRIITGGTSPLLGGAAACIMNALKELAGLPHEEHLVSAESIAPIQTLKTAYLGGHNPRLHSDELLIALSMSAATNPHAALAMEQLPLLAGCEAHSSVILSSVDESVYRRLRLRLTMQPEYETKM